MTPFERGIYLYLMSKQAGVPVEIPWLPILGAAGGLGAGVASDDSALYGGVRGAFIGGSTGIGAHLGSELGRLVGDEATKSMSPGWAAILQLALQLSGLGLGGLIGYGVSRDILSPFKPRKSWKQ